MSSDAGLVFAPHVRLARQYSGAHGAGWRAKSRTDLLLRRPTTFLALSTAAATTLATASVLVAGGAYADAPASGKAQRVIVLLANQHTSTPAARATLGARRAAVRPTSARSARHRPARRPDDEGLHDVNAVAATVPSGGLDALRANPAVTAVVPDLPISMPRQAATSSAAAPAGQPRAAGGTAPPTRASRSSSRRPWS